MSKSFKVLFIYLVCTIYCSLLFAQAPDTLWTRTYGGEYDDQAYSAQKITGAGLIIAGYTASYGTGGNDVWLLMTDSSGDTTWTSTFGGANNDVAYSVQQTSDDGFVIAGYTNSFGAGGYDVYLIKTDAQGDTLWTKTYGGSNDDFGYAVQQCSDGGYIITGKSGTIYDTRVYVIKTDTDGNSLWAGTYGDPPDCCGWSVQQTSDGGYIVAGYLADPCGDYYNLYLIKTDSSGDTIWTRDYGYAYVDQVGKSIQKTADHSYIIAGYTVPPGASFKDVYLVKTDETGDTIWTKKYGGVDDDEAWSVEQTSDGGYIIVGESVSSGSLTDAYIIKTDANGDTIWSKTFGGGSLDCGCSAQQMQDSLYVIAGYTESFGAGSSDVWIVKLEPDVGIEDENIVVRNKAFATTIISGPLSIPEGRKCRVFDVSGKRVKHTQIKPGIYFIVVEGKLSHKVVKIK